MRLAISSDVYLTAILGQQYCNYGTHILVKDSGKTSRSPISKTYLSLKFQLARSVLEIQDRDYYVASLLEVGSLFEGNNSFIMEFPFYSRETYKRAYIDSASFQFGQSRDNVAVTHYADLFIPSLRNLPLLNNLARLDAFSKWYRKLSGLDFSTLLIPELAKKPKSLAGKRCETFSAQNLRILSRKLIATEVCSESTLDLINDTFPVILGINSIEEIRGTNLLDLMANFYKDREYLVKPRYTLANEVETIALLERHIGRQSLNTKYGLSYPETCAIPLEFVLLAIANSYYCGPFTGALHTLIPHRVTVSSFHNLKLEKLFKDNYFAFQYFWGGNKD